MGNSRLDRSVFTWMDVLIHIGQNRRVIHTATETGEKGERKGQWATRIVYETNETLIEIRRRAGRIVPSSFSFFPISKCSRTTRTETRTITYEASVIYASGEAVVWSDSPSCDKLVPGQHQFPFKFFLPPTCAPSFEGYCIYCF